MRLVHEQDEDAPIRVWAVGCATGEEAYSLAMVFAEELAAAEKHCPLQVFATALAVDSADTLGPRLRGAWRSLTRPLARPIETETGVGAYAMA